MGQLATPPCRVGFIGLGDMGGPMACNLVDKGFDVRVFDIRQDAVADLVKRGAKSAEKLALMPDECDVIGICVWSEEQLLSILYGEDGLLCSNAPGLTLVIHCTVKPKTVQHVAETCKEKGWTVLDVPVSGGRAGSIAGTLTLMVGGGKEAFSRCMPYFKAVGKNIFHIGETSGAGEIAKLCNNLMALCNAYVVTEALKLATAYEIPESVIFDVAQVSTGNSWFVENREFFDTIISTHPQPNVLYKDLWEAIEAGKEEGVELLIPGVLALVAPRLTKERMAVLSRAGRVSSED